ncbi:hypothetical protein WG66_004260 [Moniliophthora roreri]|nr:hypothetical protein WG66_004260 [Moniliophthora roreri]
MVYEVGSDTLRYPKKISNRPEPKTYHPLNHLRRLDKGKESDNTGYLSGALTGTLMAAFSFRSRQ